MPLGVQSQAISVCRFVQPLIGGPDQPTQVQNLSREVQILLNPEYRARRNHNAQSPIALHVGCRCFRFFAECGNAAL